MAIEGPLRELSLSDVFQLLDLSRKTGVLTVRGETASRPAVIRFERGAVVGAELDGHSGELGHLLLRAGKATERGLERARQEQRARPEKPFGALLVELGVASEDDVRRQLRFQIEQTVYELIRWTEGYFRFVEEPAVEAGGVAVRLSTESLLMEAARRIDEWTTLEAKVPHMNVVPRLTGNESGALLDLKPAEWEVLAEIDGERTLKAIALALGKSDFDVGRIAYGLVATGVVELVEAGVAARVAEPARGAVEEQVARGRALAAEGRPGEALAVLGRAVRADPLLATAHYHLGAAALRAGNLERAEEAWNTYLRLADPAPRARAAVRQGVGALAVLRRLLSEEVE
jgi:tetratricopeptide (TPR) repeat protein